MEKEIDVDPNTFRQEAEELGLDIGAIVDKEENRKKRRAAAERRRWWKLPEDERRKRRREKYERYGC